MVQEVAGIFISEDNLNKIIKLLKENDTEGIKAIIDEVLEKNGKGENAAKQASEIWSLYPDKKGKASAVKKIPKIIGQYSYDELVRAIDRYKQDTENRRKDFPGLKYQNGSTFFTSGYVDYLDENYIDVFAKEPTPSKPSMAAYQVVNVGCCPTCEGEGLVRKDNKWVDCPDCGGGKR